MQGTLDMRALPAGAELGAYRPQLPKWSSSCWDVAVEVAGCFQGEGASAGMHSLVAGWAWGRGVGGPQPASLGRGCRNTYPSRAALTPCP